MIPHGAKSLGTGSDLFCDVDGSLQWGRKEKTVWDGFLHRRCVRFAVCGTEPRMAHQTILAASLQTFCFYRTMRKKTWKRMIRIGTRQMNLSYESLQTSGWTTCYSRFSPARLYASRYPCTQPPDLQTPSPSSFCVDFFWHSPHFWSVEPPFSAPLKGRSSESFRVMTLSNNIIQIARSVL